MDVKDTDVLVIPDHDLIKLYGQILLELADSPKDVQYISWPEAGYKVPVELYQRFAAERDAQEGSPQPENLEPPKRKPGRPRKNPVSDTDNNEKDKEE